MNKRRRVRGVGTLGQVAFFSARLRGRRRKFAEFGRSSSAHLLRRAASEIALPAYGPDLPDDHTANSVLDVALRIGEIQMYCGAGAADVTATIRAVTRALGLPDCEVDVILTSITVTCHRGSSAPPLTVVRVVPGRGHNFNRLSETESLVRRIINGDADVAAAQSDIVRLAQDPYPYPRWVSTLSWGLMAAFITLILGGGIDIAVAAMVITIIVDRVVRLLNSIALPPFFQQLAGGLVVMFGSTAIVSTGLMTRSQPTLLVAAALTVLLSGMATVAAVQDAITGFNVTAAGRFVEIAMMGAGLISGVLIALKATVVFGVKPVPLPDLAAFTSIRLPIVAVASICAAACFAIACYARGREVLVAAVAGGIGGTVSAGLRLTTIGPVGSAAVAAALVGLCGGYIARRSGVTPLVAGVSGITPMVPGLSTYVGMYEVGISPGGKIDTLAGAAGVSIALAAGVVLGEFLSQPFRRGRKGSAKRLAGPRMAGPLETSE